MLVGYDVRIAARFKLKRRTTSVRLPPTAMLSNRSSELSEASRTRIPIQLMALGSVACTVTLWAASGGVPGQPAPGGGRVPWAADGPRPVRRGPAPRRPLAAAASPGGVNGPGFAEDASGRRVTSNSVTVSVLSAAN